jgi:hypothetical protein
MREGVFFLSLGRGGWGLWGLYMGSFWCDFALDFIFSCLVFFLSVCFVGSRTRPHIFFCRCFCRKVVFFSFVVCKCFVAIPTIRGVVVFRGEYIILLVVSCIAWLFESL